MNQSAKWQKIGLSVLCVFLALVLIVMVFATVYVHYLLSRMNSVGDDYDDTLPPELLQTETETVDPTYTGPYVDPTDITLDLVPTTEMIDKVDSQVINIMLVGQDRREGEPRQRSDVMILCTFNLAKNTFTMTSFMRDTWVYIPGRGYDKMNAAFRYGGFSLLNETLAVNFGVHVDGNVAVDFYGFTDIIDFVGGVDIKLTAKEAAYMNKNTGFEYNQGEKWNLKEGVNHLTGDQALAYSRIRHLDSDFYRTARQRTVISALVDSVKDMSLTALLGMVDDVLPMVTTNLTDHEVLSYAVTLFPVLTSGQMVSMRLPADGTFVDEWLLNKGSNLIPDLQANRKILQEIMSTD